MIRQNLAHHYHHFDKWIVVDGPALPKNYETSGDGRRLTGGRPYSTDGTTEMVSEFKKSHPNVVLLRKNRPWNGKVEMFNAALALIDDGYVWQIDVDEFWHHKTIDHMKGFLERNPDYTEVETWAYHYWGDPFHHCRIDKTAWGNKEPWRRVFKIRKGEIFSRHEPPRIRRSERNNVLTREKAWAMGFHFHHFGYVMKQQFIDRERFYGLKSGELVNPLMEWRKHRPNHSVAGHLEMVRVPQPIETSFMYE